MSALGNSQTTFYQRIKAFPDGAGYCAFYTDLRHEVTRVEGEGTLLRLTYNLFSKPKGGNHNGDGGNGGNGGNDGKGEGSKGGAGEGAGGAAAVAAAAAAAAASAADDGGACALARASPRPKSCWRATPRAHRSSRGGSTTTRARRAAQQQKRIRRWAGGAAAAGHDLLDVDDDGDETDGPRRGGPPSPRAPRRLARTLPQAKFLGEARAVRDEVAGHARHGGGRAAQLTLLPGRFPGRARCRAPAGRRWSACGGS